MSDDDVRALVRMMTKCHPPLSVAEASRVEAEMLGLLADRGPMDSVRWDIGHWCQEMGDRCMKDPGHDGPCVGVEDADERGLEKVG